MHTIKINYIKSLILFLITITTISCNNNTQNNFDREEYVFRYLKEVANINTNNQNEFILFIINNNVCSCSGDVNEIIGTNFSYNNQPKYLIAGKYDSSVIDSLKLKLSNLSVLIDKDENLSKYGINNATHYLFDIKDNKIIYWCPISNATKDRIKKKYFTQQP